MLGALLTFGLDHYCGCHLRSRVFYLRLPADLPYTAHEKYLDGVVLVGRNHDDLMDHRMDHCRKVDISPAPLLQRATYPNTCQYPRIQRHAGSRVQLIRQLVHVWCLGLFLALP